MVKNLRQDKEVENNTSKEKMVGIIQNMNKIIEIASNLYQKSKKRNFSEIPKDVVLFFSFDIVNSTEYKVVNYYGWAKVLNHLFKVLKNEVKNKISNSEMWRVLGDEAVFIVKIKGEDELRDIINKIFEILVTMIYKIKKGEFFESLSGNKKEMQQMQMQNILSLKAAAWMAIVSNVGNIDLNDSLEDNPELENIFERYTSHEGYDIFEFLGNDIDTGFRIAKHTLDGRLVVSYELAHFISQKTESASYLHIITYKRLKGIWKDSLYPIIWYHNPKSYKDFLQKELTLEESFPFDAYEEYELVKEYYNNRNTDCKNRIVRDLNMFTNIPYALNKIENDRGIQNKIHRLQEMIQNTQDQKINYLNTDNLQMHCAVVCFKRSCQGKIEILTAKRSKSKKILPGKWEFGGAKITVNKSIIDQVREDYKKDFNIDIVPILDKHRTDTQPIPLALYQISGESAWSRDDITNKGVIILAEVVEDSDIKINKSKHDEYKWIEEDEINTVFGDKDCVNDFLETLKLAFEKIKALE